MGLLDELKRLAHPYSEEEEDFDDFIPNRSGHTTSASESAHRDTKVVTIPTTTQLQVVLVKPERFDNAPEIADHLRETRTVVLNLESANKEIARRLVDFLSGVAYARDGKIKRVANSTYIITPNNVDILGDLIDELENNGLYF
ncbi:MAG: cell division protein SepF [Oscillospiraceae bacterium]|jgi:cell division inhibitor SepF|nr:cell division protein SepF [Oscillospiraceae bacterium]